MPQEVRKSMGGYVTKFMDEERNGVKVGIIEGYIATWDVDRGDPWSGIKDQFIKGSFADSLAELKLRNRDIRFKDRHRNAVGIFPIDKVKEDERGLFGVAEVNMEIEQGRDIMALVKQGALSDFSIGASIDESKIVGEIRAITKATIWEGSIVDEPMNPHANVVGFKSIDGLGAASKDTKWNPVEAAKRAGVDQQYNILDMVCGELKIIPEAVEAVTKTAIEDVENLPATVILMLEKACVQIGTNSPFKSENKRYFVESEVKDLNPRDFEKALRRGATFSKSAAKFMASKYKLDEPGETQDNIDIIAEIQKSLGDI